MANSLNELNHRITLDKAVEMTRIYRENKEQILHPDHAGTDILPLAETMNRAAMDQLLAQPGCSGIRIYYAMDEQLKVHAVLVGVDEQGQDILPPAEQASNVSGDEGVILEEMQRCPPTCTTSLLNP